MRPPACKTIEPFVVSAGFVKLCCFGVGPYIESIGFVAQIVSSLRGLVICGHMFVVLVS